MTIVARNHRVAPSALSSILHDVQTCVDPGCEARADPEYPVPLCDTHARRVAMRWFATHQHAPADSGMDDVPTEPAPAAQGLVYFLKFGDRVKIGFTTNLAKRMQAIPHDELLGTVPGTMRDEARCHAVFASTRITGEWFEDTEDLRTFILDVCQ